MHTMRPLFQFATVIGFQAVLLVLALAALRSLTEPRSAAPVQWTAPGAAVLLDFDETLR